MLLLTSPRVAAGLLSSDAWRALSEGDVLVGHADEPQVQALQDAGLQVQAPAHPAGPALGRDLVTRARDGGNVVWIGSSDGDPGLSDVIAGEVSRLSDPPDVEVVLGSYDVPGARLLDLVAVMDRLRSPGGCPWDREQTHTSLVPYLVEEAHEAVEAIESGDRTHIVEELGDVLLQVVFHARIGEEGPTEPFDIDDVAAAIVAKLVRRHPHVFADATASSASDVETNWEAIKAAERLEMVGEATTADDPLRGIPAALPPLARATKVLRRLRRVGQDDAIAQATAGSDAGARLLALVAEVSSEGVDPDAALRATLRDLAERVGPASTSS
jgi:XTP/dITP diphosphohydrolase